MHVQAHRIVIIMSYLSTFFMKGLHQYIYFSIKFNWQHFIIIIIYILILKDQFCAPPSGRMEYIDWDPALTRAATGCHIGLMELTKWLKYSGQHSNETVEASTVPPWLTNIS